MRALSERLGVAPDTVARAYRELEARRRDRHPRPPRHLRRAPPCWPATTTDASAVAAAFVDAVRRAGLTLPEAIRLVERAWPR